MSTERTIMVADTKTQKKYKITTNATTLGELKQCLAANNINYDGMSFTEGITKTTLEGDATFLPTNIPYKGSTTNNLVLLLTNTKKNISSGMNRKEAYSLIKRYGLQDKVKSIHGRNFTQVPTESLEEIITSYGSEPADKESKGEESKPEVTSIVEEIDMEEPCDVKSLIVSLCKAMAAKGMLDEDDLADMAGQITELGSDFDIDAMMAGL